MSFFSVVEDGQSRSLFWSSINALFHHSELIPRMCPEAGEKLVYLPPRSPDLTPIQEFSAGLERFIRCNWTYYAENPTRDSTRVVRLGKEKKVRRAFSAHRPEYWNFR